MIKSISLFLLKNNNKKKIYFIKINPQHKHAKWPPSDLTPWTLTLGCTQHHTIFAKQPTDLSCTPPPLDGARGRRQGMLPSAAAAASPQRVSARRKKGTLQKRVEHHLS